jgi:hypothetical protein
MMGQNYLCHFKHLHQMKSNTATTSPANSLLVAFSTARIVRHPRAKKVKAEKVVAASPPPPDEETLARLNAMARQHPFCIRHKASNNKLL